MSYYISTGTGASTERSDTTYGLTMTDANYGEVKARTAYVTLPYRQGAIDCTPTDANGKPYMERRTITFEFLAQSSTVSGLNAALGQVRAWFAGMTTFYDSFQDATLTGVHLESCKDEYVGQFCRACKLTVVLTADPYMTVTGGTRL